MRGARSNEKVWTTLSTVKYTLAMSEICSTQHGAEIATESGWLEPE
jgi:hypothetical protein